MAEPELHEVLRYDPGVLRAGLRAYEGWDSEREDAVTMVAAVFHAMAGAQPSLRQLLLQHAFEAQNVRRGDKQEGGRKNLREHRVEGVPDIGS